MHVVNDITPRRLTGLVQGRASDDMRVQHREVEWSHIDVAVRNSDKHGAVHDGRSSRAEDHTAWLSTAAQITLDVFERSVRCVELRDPGEKLERRCQGKS